MNFLIDAHLPFYWKEKLHLIGHNAIHTSELQNKNETTDTEINRISLEQKRILITKDKDFLDSFLLSQKPYKLVLVKTGNLKLSEMKILFDRHLENLMEALEQFSLIELYENDLFIVE